MVLDVDYYLTLPDICCVNNVLFFCFVLFCFYFSKHINMLIVFFEREDVDRR